MTCRSWIKVDAALDSHPRIRRAGRNGREVFLFALRRNRLRGGHEADGRIPRGDLDPEYVASMLQMRPDEAEAGLEAAVQAGLLVLDGDTFTIPGFDAGWGCGKPPPLTEAERKRAQRARARAQVSGQCPDMSRDVTDGHVTSPDCPDCHAEERRGDLSRARNGCAGAIPAAPSDPADPVLGTPDSALGTAHTVAAVARRSLGDELWRLHQETRAEVAAELQLEGDDALPLPIADQGRALLAERILESADEGLDVVRRRCRKVLERVRRDCLRDGTLRYLDGQMWQKVRFDKANATPLSDDKRKREGPRKRDDWTAILDDIEPQRGSK